MASSTCVYCGRDRGRRRCPALHGLISPACCGRHRAVTIDCPPDCLYYRKHEEYQRRRWVPEFQRAWGKAMEPLYREQADDSIAFAVYLEQVLYVHYALRPRGTDADVLQALGRVREELGPIAVVAVELPPRDVERRLFEATRAYLQRAGGLDPEAARRAVDALAAAIATLQDPRGRDPRRALHGLLGHVERVLGLPPELQAHLQDPASSIETPRILRPTSGSPPSGLDG